MPADTNLVAAAYGVARQSRPASACNDKRLGSRRPPSACSRPAESAVERSFLAQTLPHKQAGSTNSSAADEATLDVEREPSSAVNDTITDNMFLQGKGHQQLSASGGTTA